MTGDTLTILHSVSRKYATKQLRLTKSSKVENRSYGNEKFFRVESRPVADFAEYSAALTALTKEVFAFIIRGSPLANINRAHARRLLHRDPKTGDEPTFSAAPRRWFALDFDHIQAPALTDAATDPEAAIQHLIGLLPPEFHDASCFWQFTASQSLPDHEATLSARLWYWSEEPLSDAELTRWAAHVNRDGKLIDPALFRPVQATYIASPVFEESLPDPLPRRCGVRQGLEDTVCVILPPPDPVNPEVVSGEGYEPGLGVDAYLAMIGGGQGFREPIVKAIASFIAINGSSADCSKLKEAIRKAVDAADPGGRSAEQLDRYKSDAHLDDIIAWVRQHHGDQPPKGWTQQPPPGFDDPPPAEPEPDAEPVATTLSELIDVFNARYAVVNEAGKAMIFELCFDPVRGRQVLTRILFPDFRKFYMNRMLTVGDVTHTHANWWLNSPRRRQYINGVVFDPTGKVRPGVWNLWRGFAVKPAPGDWGLMQDHVRRVICAGDEALAEYVFNYLARMFQRPDRPGEVAIVLRGGLGVGKGIFLNSVLRAWGQHGCHISNVKHLVGNFNAHLRDCVMLFADEAFFAGDRSHEGVLKALITEPTLPIEGKYQNLVEVINMLHLFISSNSDWVVPAAIAERRFCVCDVPDNRAGNHPYFDAIAAQMEVGGLAAMLHDLLNRDISTFDVRAVPHTAALQTQKTLSLASIERWWLTVLSRGYLWKSRHGAPWFYDWHEFYTTELLERSYLQWCNERRPLDRKTRVQLGAFFTRVYDPSRPRGPHPVYEIDSIDRGAIDVVTDAHGGVSTVPKALDEIAIAWSDHPHGYCVGELDEARARFLELHTVDADWLDHP